MVKFKTIQFTAEEHEEIMRLRAKMEVISGKRLTLSEMVMQLIKEAK